MLTRLQRGAKPVYYGGQGDGSDDPNDRDYKEKYRKHYGSFWPATLNHMFSSAAAANSFGDPPHVYYTYYCAWCGYDFPREQDLSHIRALGGDYNQDITIDHRVSVRKHWEGGGKNMTDDQLHDWYNDQTNLQLLCRTCNSSKGE
jgi:hypothetical protein